MIPMLDPARRADIYLADEALCIAAQVAMQLGQPLLLTGEPGTGKTTFANYLAEKLAPAGPLNLYTFETKSTSMATDLFYRFDSLRRFHDSHDGNCKLEARDYLSFEALGQAILFSQPWEAVQDLLPDPAQHPGQQRSVVLIDEIDKAPRDFPNDILNEIDRMFFRIPEVRKPGTSEVRRVDADPNPALRPIIVLTSNSERNLPAAFLRRCVFHHIEFPGREQSERLKQIISKNLGQAVGELANDVLAFFLDVRELRLDKPPTTAELVQWISVLQARPWAGVTAGDVGKLPLKSLPIEQLKATLGVLAKTSEDVKRVQGLLAQRWGA